MPGRWSAAAARIRNSPQVARRARWRAVAEKLPRASARQNRRRRRRAVAERVALARDYLGADAAREDRAAGARALRPLRRSGVEFSPRRRAARGARRRTNPARPPRCRPSAICCSVSRRRRPMISRTTCGCCASAARCAWRTARCSGSKRRKGAKNTLVDENDRPLPEDHLPRWLGAGRSRDVRRRIRPDRGGLAQGRPRPARSGRRPRRNAGREFGRSQRAVRVA